MNPSDLPQAPLKNSTTGRSYDSQPPWWLKTGLVVLDTLMPHTAAWLLQRLFTTPPRPPLRADEAGILTSARRWQSRVRGMMVQGYEWGEGPAVLLIHGWGGHAGHMSGMVEPLVHAGFRVVAVDAPGHGHSPPGRSTILHFHEAIEAMARHAGPVHGIVSHSLGAAATTYALSRGLDIPRVVFIGPFTHFSALWHALQQRTGASWALIRRMIGRLEIASTIGFEELDPLTLAQDRQTPLLVIHDLNDDKVGFEQGLKLVQNWPGAELRSTSQLGHLKILKDKAVQAAAVDFLQRPNTHH